VVDLASILTRKSLDAQFQLFRLQGLGQKPKYDQFESPLAKANLVSLKPRDPLAGTLIKRGTAALPKAHLSNKKAGFSSSQTMMRSFALEHQ
jgi:hypothetical protein